MKRLFDLDNPVMRALGKLYDLLITNILFLVCSVPVVTFGASLAAMTKVTQNLVHETGSGTARTFFRAFRSNFRQATVLWLILAAFFVCVVCNLVLIDTYIAGTAAQVMRVALVMFAVVVVAVACYMFPLLVRYENTLLAHCRNALILTGAKLPRTICLVVLTLLPAALAYYSLTTFLRWSLLFSVIGFAGLNYLCSLLLRPVMAQLERSAQPPAAEEKDPEQARTPV